jgi:hypothetical protein
LQSLLTSWSFGGIVFFTFVLVVERWNLSSVVPPLGSATIPSHPTLYRLNLWSSWVRRKGTTQVMYITKLKDGPKRGKKNFSMILESVFEMV